MGYFAGQGTIIKIGTASGASLPAPGSDTFTALTLCNALKLPSYIRTVNTFKTLDSADPRRVGGGFEERTISFRLVFDPADAKHIVLKGDAESATIVRRNWQIVLPDSGAAQFDFVAFCSKWEWEDVEGEKEVAATIELSVDGAVTYTP